MNSSLSYEKLVMFLYLLMRDVAPTGFVVSALRETVKAVAETEVTPESPNTYSSKELQAYAERLATEMVTG